MWTCGAGIGEGYLGGLEPLVTTDEESGETAASRFNSRRLCLQLCLVSSRLGAVQDSIFLDIQRRFIQKFYDLLGSLSILQGFFVVRWECKPEV